MAAVSHDPGTHAAADLLEHLDLGVALLDAAGYAVHASQRFMELVGRTASRALLDGESFGQIVEALAREERIFGLRRARRAIAASALPTVLEVRRRRGGWVVLTVRPLPDGRTLVLASEDLPARRRDAALAVLLQSQVTGIDRHAHAAHALATSLRYRWAFVTVFANDTRYAHVVGSWMDGRKGEPFLYELPGTPCEKVIATGGFVCIPERVSALFPADRGLLELRAEAYVGDVYFGADGRPAGHVFAVNDEPDIDSSVAREATRIITAWVGRELQLDAIRESTTAALREARIDALTRSRNRKAFDEDLASLHGAHPESVFLAMIDIDGLKAVNDSLGHAVGDRLLVSFAEALTSRLRAVDHVYRIGGDEFAVLLTDGNDGTTRSLKERVAAAVVDVQGHGFTSIGASVGCARASEVAADLGALLTLADERMYEEKRSRKARR
jgi:diguanylate cyclase (GGDEF)-like protein